MRHSNVMFLRLEGVLGFFEAASADEMLGRFRSEEENGEEEGGLDPLDCWGRVRGGLKGKK